MTSGVRYSPLAEAEIFDISLRIGAENEAAGRHFALAVYETALSLSKFPESGTPMSFGDAGLRACRWSCVNGFKKYLLFYRIRGREIEVVRVLHGARDLDALEE